MSIDEFSQYLLENNISITLDPTIITQQIDTSNITVQQINGIDSSFIAISIDLYTGITTKYLTADSSGTLLGI